MQRRQAKIKGHSFEREIAQDFRTIGFVNAERHLEYQTSQAGKDLRGTEPFKIQCKFHKDYVSINTIQEVKRGKGDIPLLLTKANRKPVMAVMYWEDLKELIFLTKHHGR